VASTKQGVYSSLSVEHLLLTHVNEENITRSSLGRWYIWREGCSPLVTECLDRFVRDGLVFVNRYGVACLEHPAGFDLLIRLDSEVGFYTTHGGELQGDT
jgi:hypothetical protein